MTRRLLLGAGLLVLAAIAAAVAISFFNSRDSSTVTHPPGPGTVRATNAGPHVGTGNVVLMYADPAERKPLNALADAEAGPASPALESAGQAVILQHDATLDVGVRAVTAGHSLDAQSSGDPALRNFVEFWLGRAPG